jgi:predicted nuclease with TOPRIM domain
MNRSKLPNGVLSRLVELDEQVEDLTRKLANTEKGIADARHRLSGNFRHQAEYHDLSASLKELAADKPTLEKKLHTAQSVLSNCKAWLDRLPEGSLGITTKSDFVFAQPRPGPDIGGATPPNY